MRVLSVVGARPNFMKLAPVHRALEQSGQCEHVIVHTGQHYDAGMSDTFFTDLDIPAPDTNLNVGSASHAQQTAEIMKRIEPVLLETRPDTVLVYGDVNSTVAAGLVAAKLGVRIGHVEAGLRSGDWSMPEEINRVVTDRLADLLFTPSRDADENLRSEGVAPDRIHFVGNVMLDSLVAALPKARALEAAARRRLASGDYVVVTLHRPANVDDPAVLAQLCGALADLAADRAVVFPVHPRTRARMREFGVTPTAGDRLRLEEPVGYLEMLSLIDGAALAITDSGGLQEETTFLGVPCLTVRHNTERPVTVLEGTNRLVRPEHAAILRAAHDVPGRAGQPCSIEFWDGRAAGRIAQVLLSSAHTAAHA